MSFIALLILCLVRSALWFRYKVTIKGQECLNPKILNKTGGVLFLPNHPTVFVDPTLVTLAIWKKYPLRPVIVEYMYYLPIVHTVMKMMRAIPIPNFVLSSNSLKKKRAENAVDEVIKGLKNKENFLIYPAGKTKHQAHEIVSGSAVHKILQEVPSVNIVLVRTTGLWGSRFSRALTGKTPPLFQAIFWGVKTVLKNLLFLTPRRHVTIEFTPAPADFPWQSSRLELNRYLERWYNRPDGLSEQHGSEPGESLVLVSYSRWKTELPEVLSQVKNDAQVDLAKIPLQTQEKVRKKISDLRAIPETQILPELDLTSDLGLDSLDIAELVVFLDDAFEVSGVPANEMTTVGKVMGLAARQVTFSPSEEEESVDLSRWFSTRPHKKACLSEGATLPEVFLNTCTRLGPEPACGDVRSGVLTYSQLKMRAILLARHIQKLPGETVGVLLPSSVAAYVVILATQLAGKVPLLINWTVGARHLESVVALSNIQVVLSSWAFLDRLDNVDLNGIEDLIVMLEDMRREFSLLDKIAAFALSKRSPQSILRAMGYKKLPSDHAVLLFTSGTESQPKGVPLSHDNILSNQKSALHDVCIYEDDCLLGMLPPFHAFGFTVTGLLPLLAGVRVCYFADPTDGSGAARAISHWHTTLVCGTPSFLKAIFKNSHCNDLKTVRLCISGAEKAPQELFDLAATIPGCVLVEGYGITECSPVISIDLGDRDARGGTFPVEGVELEIVSLETHTPVPRGTQGLILVRGPNVFSGYLNPGIAPPFLKLGETSWYITGDLGHLDQQGRLFLSGRLKRFVKIGGEMISLGAVEDALQSSFHHRAPDQESSYLALVAKEEAGQKTRLSLFTTFPLSLEEANAALKDARFSNLVRLSQITTLSQIPLMGSGKTNYRALEAIAFPPTNP